MNGVRFLNGYISLVCCQLEGRSRSTIRERDIYSLGQLCDPSPDSQWWLTSPVVWWERVILLSGPLMGVRGWGYEPKARPQEGEIRTRSPQVEGGGAFSLGHWRGTSIYLCWGYLWRVTSLLSRVWLLWAVGTCMAATGYDYWAMTDWLWLATATGSDWLLRLVFTGYYDCLWLTTYCSDCMAMTGMLSGYARLSAMIGTRSRITLLYHGWYGLYLNRFYPKQSPCKPPGLHNPLAFPFQSPSYHMS